MLLSILTNNPQGSISYLNRSTWNNRKVISLQCSVFVNTAENSVAREESQERARIQRTIFNMGSFRRIRKWSEFWGSVRVRAACPIYTAEAKGEFCQTMEWFLWWEKGMRKWWERNHLAHFSLWAKTELKSTFPEREVDWAEPCATDCSTSCPGFFYSPGISSSTFLQQGDLIWQQPLRAYTD